MLWGMRVFPIAHKEREIVGRSVHTIICYRISKEMLNSTSMFASYWDLLEIQILTSCIQAEFTALMPVLHHDFRGFPGQLVCNIAEL